MKWIAAVALLACSDTNTAPKVIEAASVRTEPAPVPTPAPAPAEPAAAEPVPFSTAPLAWRHDQQLSSGITAMWIADDGTKGWAVGSSGHVYRLIPGAPTQWRRDDSASALTHANLTCLWVRADGGEGWAMGSEGAVLRLDGNGWQRHEPEVLDRRPEAPGLAITGISVSADGQRGWAVGTMESGPGGAVLKLEQGKWTQQLSGLYGRAVWMRDDGEQGWALADGALWQLVDGAWAEDKSTRDLFQGLLFALWVSDDGSRGFAMGTHDLKTNKGVVLRLADGEWQLDPNGRPEPDEVVTGVRGNQDGSRAWAVGTGGTVWQLDGDRWMIDTAASELSDVVMEIVWMSPDLSRGWVHAEGELLEIEGGVWRRRDDIGQTGGGEILDAWIDGQGARGWAVGRHAILTLQDGHWRWGPHVDPAELAAENLHALWVSDDGTRGWALGSKVFELVDGRWIRRELDERVFGVETVVVSEDGRRGWAFADYMVISLVDGRWQRHAETEAMLAECPMGAKVNAAWLSDDGSQGWAVGRDDVILRFDGSKWARVNECGPSAVGWLRALAVSRDQSRGWAVGDGGAVYALRDDVWSKQTDASELTDEDLEDVWVHADGMIGWAVGERGTILRLEDGRWRVAIAADALTREALHAVVSSDDGSIAWALGSPRLVFDPVQR
jgi:photosystem II stability/assembly factor-like uncharacterized protein